MSRDVRRRLSPLGLAVLAAALVWPAQARALELTQLSERTLRLDLTATTVGNWHGDNRNNLDYDDDFGDLFNRVNIQLSWWRLVGAVRLDTAAFVAQPDPAALALKHATDPNDSSEVNRLQSRYWERLRSRHRDSIWLGKSFLTFSSPMLEVTAGDSYVSLGRGLVLSMRKDDELSSDSTLLGGKVLARLGWFSATLAGGVANPVRVDEGTGQTLYPVDPSVAERARGIEEVPVFRQDRLFGGRLEGSGSLGSISLQGVHMLRPSTLDQTSGVRGARILDVGGGSASLSFPKGSGAAYVEGAYQRVDDEDGYAFYGSVSGIWGPVNGVVEWQHYREFKALLATVHSTQADAFRFLQYSAPPTTEGLTADNRYGSFNEHVSGGRARVNGLVAPWLTAWGAVGYWATRGERLQRLRNDVVDGMAGAEIYFDEHRSHLFASAGARRDWQDEDGALYYREFHVEGSAAKALSGPWSLEIEGLYRRRFHTTENTQDGVPEPWSEAELSLAAKYSPYVVAGFGVEYTGQKGQVRSDEEPLFFNGSLLVKYQSDASVRLFVGQQRGSLKCVSGICRQFAPFEGVKLEWTQRY
ncbi:MAG: hypothetical protein HY901_01260 [Deltaproteobacteria bacterium]|nr:hypothetical protein [Deltaproteobacteria bacterium]